MKLNNKIIATVFASSLGLAMLTGCDAFEDGFSDGLGKTTTVTPQTNVLPAENPAGRNYATSERPAPGAIPSDPDQKFIWLIDHSNQISDGEVTVEYPKQVTTELIEFGKAVCSDLDKGIYSSASEAALEIWSGDADNKLFTIQEMNYIVAAAVTSFCPWEK